jgi:uncharacterized protein YcaQ
MEFLQADPIRAPARAQDLILRHRVKDYKAGDLERRYASLDIEEDVFINYGFVTRSLYQRMHPRTDALVSADGTGSPWSRTPWKQTEQLLEFIRDRGEVHPRHVDEHFSHGKVTNYWGGSSNASTHLLDAMHYRGLLRVARREKGIRIYRAHQHEAAPLDPAERSARIDSLVDVVVRIYAPLPAPSLSSYLRRLRYAVPQWQSEISAAIQRARERLSHAHVDGTDWYWPARERVQGSRSNVSSATGADAVRLLAPFDSLVHDRQRFEMLWGWSYRFEAYTPAHKRKLGYYALPLLWRDRVVGWGNLSVKDGKLETEFGFVESPPRDREFKRELEAEVERMRMFLGVSSGPD